MKRFFFAFVCALVAVAALHAERPKVVAHRGYWNTPGSAQNSIRALIKADSIGADMAEFDVWMTADDVLVVNHDGTVDGLVIPETTSTVLREKVRLSNGEPIPTLEEYLNVAKDLKIGLVFEIKWHSDAERENLCVKKGIDMINDMGLADRTIYITFSPNAHEQLGKHGVPHYFLTGKSPKELVEMGSDGPDFHYEVFYKNTDFIPEFKRLGMPINVWTIKTPEQVQYFIDQDVDYLTTDNPELAIKMLAETPDHKDIRVMDFNLEGATSMEQAGAIIRTEHPDFVTVQGIKDTQDVTRLSMAAEMPMYLAFNGKDGVAVLSKTSPENVEVLDLPNQFLDAPCKAVICTYNLGNGIRLNVAAAGLSDENETTRQHQAEFITRKLRDAGIPAVLGTSLNDKPKSKAWDIIRGRFAEVGHIAPTFPAPIADTQYDFIFSYPVDKVEKRDSYTRPTAVSYHYPVITDITVKY